MSETKTSPAVEQAPAQKFVKVTSGTLLAKKSCNLFVAGQPLRDENGSLIVDPNKVELMFDDGTSHRVKAANVTGTYRFGAQCHIIWNVLEATANREAYNNGEPFVDAVMID